MIDRRAFLGALPVTALAARGLAVRGTPRPDISLGVQLYTFREQIAEDLDAVLATIAQIGRASCRERVYVLV